MHSHTLAGTNGSRRFRWTQALVVALCAAALCSCRAAGRRAMMPAGEPMYGQSQLPPEAYAGAPAMAAGMEGQPGPCPPCPLGPPGMEQGVPLAYQPCASCRPAGLPCPWPQDEYLCDGGDAGLPTAVTKNWEILGLESEDTVAHYDTLDGRRVVEPSNRVCIYAPRFGAVRQVVSAVANEQYDQWAGVHLPVKLTQYGESQPPLAAKQNVQPTGEIAAKPPVVMLTKQGDGVMSAAVKARGFQDAFLPYENLLVIRQGVMQSAEAAMLAKGVNAAVVWTGKQAVQVILDETGAAALVQNKNPEQVYTIGGEGKPKLRLIKVASTPFAEPGDTIDFTIRFDNVGTQTIGNVTIVDSLTTRLEYVPDSAQCSRDASFSFQANDGDSLIVRCEVTDPLPPGKGGVIRFKCKVR